MQERSVLQVSSVHDADVVVVLVSFLLKELPYIASRTESSLQSLLVNPWAI